VSPSESAVDVVVGRRVASTVGARGVTAPVGDHVALPRSLKLAGTLLVLLTCLVALAVLGILGLMAGDLGKNAAAAGGAVALAAATLPAWPAAALISASRASRARRASRWLWPLLVTALALGLAGLNGVAASSRDAGCTLFCELGLFAGVLALGTAGVMGAACWWMLRELHSHAERLSTR
jgi:hypothetical protein